MKETNPMQKEKCCDVCRRSNGVCYGCSCHTPQGQSIKENLEYMNNSFPMQKEEWGRELEPHMQEIREIIRKAKSQERQRAEDIVERMKLTGKFRDKNLNELQKKLGRNEYREVYNQALTDIIALTQKE